MTPAIQTLLILLILLQVKHMFADFFLQTPKMLAGRGRYAHMGRAQHAAIHAGGSAIALVVLGAPSTFIVVLCVLEWAVHYHIDWAKGAYSDRSGHGPAEAGYWRTFGVDQLLHQLTYVAMIWACAIYAL